MAFHGYQAFAPGETTAEMAHAIGVKLASELWGERFEVVVSTHLDKEHLHNHFVLNAVSFLDGKRYYDNKASYALMRQTSDRLCQEHSLSVIEQPKPGKAKHYSEWRAEQENKPTWRGLIREDIDAAVAPAMTMTQFFTILQKQGYKMKSNVKHLAVRPPGKEKFVRLRSLGDEYTEYAIKQRILQNQLSQRQPPVQLPRRRRATIVRSTQHIGGGFSGLQALYLRYLFKMGILPRSSASLKRTSFLLREDLRNLTTITEQTKLMCRHRISSTDQLTRYLDGLQAGLKQGYGSRKMLYNQLRRCQNSEQIESYKSQIAEHSHKLAKLRKEVRLCTGILARSGELAKKLHRNKEDQSTRREANVHEQRNRGGRSGRQHESPWH